MDRPVRVLIVDDSALVRETLSRGLGADPQIEVIGTANDPYMARDKIVQLRPDVLTLDVEMPRMDGVAFLRRLMPQFPLPVVMVSALTEKGRRITLEALDAGAVDFVTKPGSDVARGLESVIRELCAKVKSASRANVARYRGRDVQATVRPSEAGHLAASTNRVVLIGASTGGTEAVRTVLQGFPATTPGVVVVQHMPAGFTRLFAERLDDSSSMTVKEAADGDAVIPGRALIAPGGRQLEIRRSGGSYRVRLGGTETVSGHAPSVDVMMRSAATALGPHAVGVIMTGMGKDGAEGLKTLREAGGRTLGQDEASSVIYGMPRVAWEVGAVEKQISLEHISEATLSLLAREVRV